MRGFALWLMLENGLDRNGFNAVFRDQLNYLLQRVTDPRRRAALTGMQNTDWIGYILTALRNAGFADRREREEAAHDLAVYLLVTPGNLFAGYDPDSSGPMPARFTLAVRNAILNLRRTRARRERRFTAASADAAMGVADREPVPQDEELLDAFRVHLRRQAGRLAVEVLDQRLSGLTFQAISRRTNFVRLGRAGLRRLLGRVRAEAAAFARMRQDDDFLAQIERLTESEVAEAVPVLPPAFRSWQQSRPGTPPRGADYLRYFRPLLPRLWSYSTGGTRTITPDGNATVPRKVMSSR